MPFVAFIVIIIRIFYNSNFFFRLKDDQEEYIDKRGIHVVVGHYIGDVSDGPAFNITDGKTHFI